MRHTLFALVLLAAALPLIAQSGADVRVEKAICSGPGATITNCEGRTTSTTLPAGSTLIFQLLVSNFGPDPASAVTVTDVLSPSLIFERIETSSPLVTCTTPQPGSAGGTVTCTRALPPPPPGQVFVYFVRIYARISPATPVGTLTNTATVTNPEPDPGLPSNNTSTVTVNVAGAQVPTLSEWAFALTAAMLALLGAMTLRR